MVICDWSELFYFDVTRLLLTIVGADTVFLIIIIVIIIIIITATIFIVLSSMVQVICESSLWFLWAEVGQRQVAANS